MSGNCTMRRHHRGGLCVVRWATCASTRSCEACRRCVLWTTRWRALWCWWRCACRCRGTTPPARWPDAPPPRWQRWRVNVTMAR